MIAVRGRIRCKFTSCTSIEGAIAAMAERSCVTTSRRPLAASLVPRLMASSCITPIVASNSSRESTSWAALTTRAGSDKSARVTNNSALSNRTAKGLAAMVPYSKPTKTISPSEFLIM